MQWTLKKLRQSMVLPVIAAPMLLVSGPDLVIAACKAGVIGAYPLANARSAEECEQVVAAIHQALEGSEAAPYALNIIVYSKDNDRFESNLALIKRFRPALVITSVGAPNAVVEQVHAYGGLVFHDVGSMRHAEKAIAAGVDGLILLTAGAGGHTGSLNPFAFVAEVRAIWQGAIILAGSISDGRTIRAAEVLGADFAYMGTRFAATEESLAAPAYKNLLVSHSAADIIVTDRISGMNATFMRASILAAGLDPEHLPPIKGQFQPDLPEGIKAWRDIWSGGHGVGAIKDLPAVRDLVLRLRTEYTVAG